MTAESREHQRSRREKLEPLLATIAGALDVRQVFSDMSAVIQQVLPHETAILALVGPEQDSVSIHASFNVDTADLGRYRLTVAHESVTAEWTHFLAYDLEAVDRGDAGIVRARISPGDAATPAWI